MTVAPWVAHGLAAGLDRRATGRRINDPGFVAALDTYCAAVCAETGADPAFALLALHIGLYAASARHQPQAWIEGRVLVDAQQGPPEH